MKWWYPNLFTFITLEIKIYFQNKLKYLLKLGNGGKYHWNFKISILINLVVVWIYFKKVWLTKHIFYMIWFLILVLLNGINAMIIWTMIILWLQEETTVTISIQVSQSMWWLLLVPYNYKWPLFGLFKVSVESA